jgi:hypothetical protein
VQFHQTHQIKLWFLQDLTLADKHILKWVNTLRGLFNFLADDFRHKLQEQVLDVALTGFIRDDLSHLLTDGADLSRLSISGLTDLIWTTLGERNAEQTNEVSVRGLDIDKRFNERLPLADQRAELVARKVHTVETSHDLGALHFFSAQTDLTERLFFILVQVSERHFEHTALKTFRRDLGTGSAVHQGLTKGTFREDGWSLEVIPVLTGERIHNLLLATLLSLCQSLVLAPIIYYAIVDLECEGLFDPVVVVDARVEDVTLEPAILLFVAPGILLLTFLVDKVLEIFVVPICVLPLLNDERM